MIIFAVSSAYLGPLYEESVDFDFSLQGYGNLRKAREGLVKTNPSELYGFALVLDEFPEQLGLISKFIKQCDMISYGSVKRKRFVIAASDTSRVGELLRGKRYSNLDIHVCSFDILTDEVIKREIYGAILAGYHTPYEVEEESRFDLSKFSSRGTLSYTPVFSNDDMKVIENIKVRATKKETIIEDLYLENLRDTSEFHYNLRLFAINRCFDKDLKDSVFVSKWLAEYPSGKKKLHYQLLYKYVKEVDLSEKVERVLV